MTDERDRQVFPVTDFPAHPGRGPRPGIRAGVLIWAQYTSWAALMRAAGTADRLGYDDIWSWDHLLPLKGDPTGPTFEGMMTLAGWAGATRRARLGLMVAANTFRNPALLVKMVTALDHMSGGRAVLGLGGAWFEPEHAAFGLDFGRGTAERLDWLDEAAGVVRGLLDGAVVSAPASRYPVNGLANRPAPVGRSIPLLIGGGGERKTLATVARYADIWNIGSDADEARRKVPVLEAWCQKVGRDPAQIERSAGIGPLVIRHDARAGASVVERWRGQNSGWNEEIEVVTPGELIDRLAPLVELGFRAFHLDAPAPVDRETLERFVGEVIPCL